MLVVGVDGCRAGWIAVAVDLERGTWAPRVHRTFAELLAAHAQAQAIAIDVPIGLAADGPRACDELARVRLGPRRSSVFTAPSRLLLVLLDGVADYRTANARCRAELGHGIGAQAFNIFAKIREVDGAMSPDLQRRVREAHPEVCFAAMRGAACDFPKRSRAGTDERLSALRAGCVWLGDAQPAPPSGATNDDLLDALAAAWTAQRIAVGSARTLPDDPPLDPRGLRMEIVH